MCRKYGLLQKYYKNRSKVGGAKLLFNVKYVYNCVYSLFNTV